jgi:two-component system cell cycle sensor histidine kinase/response regulator CckA
VETRWRQKDGEVIDVLLSSTPLDLDAPSAEVTFTALDITARKRVEHALRKREEHYRSLVENIDLGVMLIDSGYNIIMANAATGRLFKKPGSDLVGRKCFKVFHKREVVCPHCPGVEAMATAQPAEFETEGVRDDGTRFNMRIHAFPTFGQNGAASAFIEVMEDITEKRKLEAQLQQAQKMEAIGALAGGIAHDFNNLLMGIQGNVSLMCLDMDSTHPHYERLKNIEKQVQSGARLTSHLLGYARKGKYEVKPVDFNRLVKDTSEAFGRTRKQITLSRELAEDLFTIEADQGQIEQVLWNLFVNAADAMPSAGSIILKTMNISHKDIKGKLYHPEPGNYVLLTVADTGTGMDKETMECIFDPFFTTKEMGKGHRSRISLCLWRRKGPWGTYCC